MHIKLFQPLKQDHRYGVRLYAYVKTAISSQFTHRVVYVRRPGMRRWLCDCPAQLFIETGRRRNCKHIRAVRGKLGV